MGTPRTSFEIAAVEAFHVAERGRDYWSGYRDETRAQSDRYQLKPGWRAAYGRGFESALVKVTLADGTVGWGEATEPICPEVICRLAIHLVAPFVGGRPYAHPEELWDAAYDLQRVRGHVAGYALHAIAAVDVAVWDALARRADRPLAALLSDDPAPAVPAYLSGLRRGSIAERAELLKGLVDDGLGAVKLFVTADTDATLAEIDALRDAVPGDWDLMVDALWTYEDVAAAADARARLADRGVRWLECPLIPEDLDAHVALAAAPGCAVALGEHFFTAHQNLPWFRAGALSVFQPDIGRTGLSGGLRQAALAREHGIAVTPHMGSGSPVVQALALQFWAATRPALPCEYQFDLSNLLPGAFDSGWTYANGVLALPDRPGLGVEIEESALRQASETVELWSVT